MPSNMFPKVAFNIETTSIDEGAHTFHVLKIYDEGRFIGQGTYGAVLSIREIATNAKKALKKVQCTSGMGIPQFTLRELHFLRCIDHPNIIKSEFMYGIDMGHDGFRVYIVMEQMQCTLKTLNQSTRFNFEVLSFMIYQICCGVHHLQRLKVIHRDLKPDNIGIKQTSETINGVQKESFNVKLLDFGMARIPSELIDPRMTSEVVTVNYRAPEVFLTDGDYNYPMDVWSIGCIFAELINKKVLFPFKRATESCSAPMAMRELISVLGAPDEPIFTLVKSRKWVPSIPEPADFSELFPLDKFSGDESSSSNPSERPWELSADQARDLLRRMLRFNAASRIPVKEALEHPFLCKYWRKEEADPDKITPIPAFGGINVNVDTYRRNPDDALRDIRTLVNEEMGKRHDLFPSA